MKNLKLFLTLAVLCIASPFFAQQDFIYVSDAGGFSIPPWQILRYDIDGSNPVTLVDNDFFVSNGIGWPQDIVFLESENAMLISSLVGGKITKHNASTGAFIEDFATVAGGPTRMKIGDDGYLYVVQWSNTDNKVLRFELDGTPMGEYTDVGIAQSIGIDWDSAGNLYVSSFVGDNVHQFNPSGNYVGEYVNTELVGPTNIFFDDNDHLFVLDWNGSNIEEFDANPTYVGTFAAGLPQVEGVDFLPNGNILVGNGGNASIDQFEPDGTSLGSLVPSGSGGLLQPNAVIVRENVVASVEDVELNKVKVAPTMGNEFQIRTDAAPVKQIEVIGMDGKKIADLPISETIVWNASSHAEGIYFLVITLDNDKKGTRKIVVKR
ncbi:T9SS type A sorting domain-containing protein [Aureisphaera galaxeae]|uniref:T9SS type A sorting domain-containing protein n=1 Tax=Aureisphaera galaxeae TaxID=1538023 RepID=UPI002350367C|nr:T9SS type A sorting domain-containing protein [Aureisphaera galaxeae]MDC8003227.1 T9SS type A sorting domain-containing protein [Aureisphaera galaxeae]